MKHVLVSATALLSVAMVGSNAFGQTSQTTAGQATATTHHKKVHKPAKPSLETQIQEMRQELQAEIDQLKGMLATKDEQIDALMKANQTTAQQAQTTAAQVQTMDSTVQQTAASSSTLQTSVNGLQTQSATIAEGVQQVQKSQETLKKDVEEPVAMHYKGITLTPGGFLAGESVWRERALNADIYTPWNLTPYMNSGQAHTSEWVPTARQSRISALASGKVPFGMLKGYVEGDFLSAGTTSNNIQTNSYTLRVRQAWGQATAGGFKFTAGQTWTLLMEDKKSTDAGTEVVPLFFDNNLHVGDTNIRQMTYRLQDSITPKFTLAASLENSQTLLNASNAPATFFLGNAGNASGLNNPLANYTDQVAPDVIVKAAFDPGFGHYEVGAIGRFFRDRYYPGGKTAAGAQNNTVFGGGFVANARFPVTTKLDVGLHLVAGDGTGRYGTSLLPDVTVHPNGTLEPLRNAQGLVSLEVHPTKKLDVFSYLGTEYVQRTLYVADSGALVGYAPTNQNNSGCGVEAVSSSSTGFSPGLSTCAGATRVVQQGSIGWLYRVYSGPAGKLQYGLAYSYLGRDGWSGLGGSPKATNNLIYTSFRYYIP